MPDAIPVGRKPLTAPPSWLPLLEPAAGGDGGAPGEPGSHAGFPWDGWPPLETIEYLSKLIVLIVLLMGLPWLIGKLVTDPDQVMRHAASRAGAA